MKINGEKNYEFRRGRGRCYEGVASISIFELLFIFENPGLSDHSLRIILREGKGGLIGWNFVENELNFVI